MYNSTTGEHSPFVKVEKTTGDVNANFSIKAAQQGLSAGNAGYVATGVRYLPKQEPRVETGSVQFGDDWIGLFLRGDTCAGFVMDLQTVLEGDIDPIIKIRLQYLLELLQGTNESRLST